MYLKLVEAFCSAGVQMVSSMVLWALNYIFGICERRPSWTWLVNIYRLLYCVASFCFTLFVIWCCFCDLSVCSMYELWFISMVCIFSSWLGRHKLTEIFLTISKPHRYVFVTVLYIVHEKLTVSQVIKLNSTVCAKLFELIELFDFLARCRVLRGTVLAIRKV